MRHWVQHEQDEFPCRNHSAHRMAAGVQQDHGKGGYDMRYARLQGFSLWGVALASLVALAPAAWSLPAPGPLRFIDPTPADNTTVTVGTIAVKLDAACTVNPSTLAVSLNGSPIPASSFLPFSACSGGRMTSQTVPANVSLPNSTITAG